MTTAPRNPALSGVRPLSVKRILLLLAPVAVRTALATVNGPLGLIGLILPLYSGGNRRTPVLPTPPLDPTPGERDTTGAPTPSQRAMSTTIRTRNG
jgi:hypothetical protein